MAKTHATHTAHGSQQAAQARPDTTTRADTARTDSAAAQQAFAPKYLSGFPDSVGNDTTVRPCASLPVVATPEQGAVEQYSNSPLHDTGSMCLLMAAIFFIAISYRTGYRYLENFAHNMFSVKRRENLFDDHTVNDTAIMSALVANTCIMEGLLLFYGITAAVPGIATAMQARVWLYVGALTGCTLAFYALQLLLYNLLGYVFADRTATKLWVAGYNATQSLLGLALLPVVVVTLVYPATIGTTLTVAAVLYVCSRIVFVSKGFRLFFSDFRASLYFILYLCSVEIVPPAAMLAGTIKMCELLQS